ncbi:MAG: hypothetical protein ACKV19_20140 [Verrucomicrobiales bacterium]
MSRLHALALAMGAAAVGCWAAWLCVPRQLINDGMEPAGSTADWTARRLVPHVDREGGKPDATTPPSVRRDPISGRFASAWSTEEDTRETGGAGRPAPLAFTVAASAGSEADDSSAAKERGHANSGDGAAATGATGHRNRRGGEAFVAEGMVPPRAALDEPFSAPLLVVPYAVGDPAYPATIPAVLADAVLLVANEPAIAAEVNRVEAAFLDQIAGGSEDPLDPEFQQRWLEGQEASDARLKASLGGHAWLDRHREVHRQAREGGAEGGSR